MITAFQVMKDEFSPDEKQNKIIEKGLKLFHKYYHALWW